MKCDFFKSKQKRLWPLTEIIPKPNQGTKPGVYYRCHNIAKIDEWEVFEVAQNPETAALRNPGVTRLG